MTAAGYRRCHARETNSGMPLRRAVGHAAVPDAIDRGKDRLATMTRLLRLYGPPPRFAGFIAAPLMMFVATVAQAQTTEPFFARKTITLSIGYTAGGSYDLYGRMVARHLGKHLPGAPLVIAQNMPGAGSLRAANYLYEVAPKDGTALGVVVESAALEQALANATVRYDAAKFTYVGRVATSNNIFMQWHTSKVQSIEDSRRRILARGHRSRFDRGDGAAAPQCARRHPLQAGERLSGVERGDARHGARRGRGCLVILGGGERRQEGLAAR